MSSMMTMMTMLTRGYRYYTYYSYIHNAWIVCHFVYSTYPIAIKIYRYVCPPKKNSQEEDDDGEWEVLGKSSWED
jgi:hypothetical protein